MWQFQADSSWSGISFWILWFGHQMVKWVEYTCALKALMLKQKSWKWVWMKGCELEGLLLPPPSAELSQWWVKGLPFISPVICFCILWRLFIVHYRLLHSCVPMPTILQYGVHAQWNKATLILNLWMSPAHRGQASEEEPCCFQSGAPGSS